MIPVCPTNLQGHTLDSKPYNKFRHYRDHIRPEKIEMNSINSLIGFWSKVERYNILHGNGTQSVPTWWMISDSYTSQHLDLPHFTITRTSKVTFTFKGMTHFPQLGHVVCAKWRQFRFWDSAKFQIGRVPLGPPSPMKEIQADLPTPSIWTRTKWQQTVPPSCYTQPQNQSLEIWEPAKSHHQLLGCLWKGSSRLLK